MRHKTFIFLMVVGLISMVAYAQETGSIIGTVQDTTSGVIPGAAVTLSNVDTGYSREVLTDDEGRYSARSLPLGAYEVRGELPGFSTAVRRGLTVNVGSALVVNLTLSVGEVAEEVIVTGESSLVETTNTVIGGLVDADQIADLPLNGRSFTDLALLQKGVLLSTTAGGGTSRGTGIKISISGSRQSQVTYTLDGADINDNFGQVGNVSGTVLGVDAIREFRVVTSPFSAEYARASGGEVQIVTKSGTNQFHGSIFEFHRNSALDAHQWEDNALAGGVKPGFLRNQFGASGGGPIVEDQTFFFTAYEGIRQRLSTTRNSDVPDQDLHDGIFEGTFLGVDPEIAPFLNLYPLPNDPNNLSLGDGTGRFLWFGQRVTTEDYFMARIDSQLSDDHSIYGRYVIDDGELTDPNNFGLNSVLTENRHQYFSLALTSILTPTFVNEIQITANRSVLSQADIAQDSTFGSLFSLSPEDLSPNLILLNPGEGSSIGGSDGRPETFVWNVFQIRDNANLQRGAHALKFGVNIEYFQDNNNNEFNRAPGDYVFDTPGDFLLNLPTTYTTTFPGFSPIRTVENYLFGFYLQDDWAVRPRLNLNLGLRYEPMTVHDERYGRVSSFRFPLDPTQDIDDIIDGPPLYENPSLGNFAPRLGFAWDVTGDGKTSLRGGGGLFFDHIQHLQVRVAFDRMLPSLAWGTLFQEQLLDLPTPILIDFPDAFETQAFLLNTTDSPVAIALETIQFDIQQSRKWNYTLNLQRELGWGLNADVGYSGGRGLDIVCVIDVNQRVPERSDGSLLDDDGNVLPAGTLFFMDDGPLFNENTGERIRRRVSECDSWYNAGLFSLRRRMQGGLGFQVSYTVSKSIDTASNGSGSSDFGNEGAGPIRNAAPGFLERIENKGLSAFDVAQSLSFNWSYQPPLQLSGWANHLLGGWQINGIVRMSGGPPFTVEGGDCRCGRGSRGLTTRGGPANLAPGTSYANAVDPQNPDAYFDVNLWTQPTTGTFGNSGRNILKAPGVATVDFSLFKNIPVPQFGENGKVQFRAEFFNLLNRPNFDLPEEDLFRSRRRRASDAGTIDSTDTTARQIQVGLKIVF